jgi:hypothetical protein
MEAVRAALARLAAAPGNPAVMDALAASLGEAEPPERDEAVERAQRILSGHADSLVPLGRALCGQSFPGCGLLGARVLIAALAADPQVDHGVEALADALSSLAVEDGEPLADRALHLTGRDPRLLLVKAHWRRSDGRISEARQLALDAREAALARMAAAPDDGAVTDALAASLADAEPAERDEAVERAQRALAGRADSLMTLGRALYGQSFPGCELLGARVLEDALAANPSDGRGRPRTRRLPGGGCRELA